MIDKPIKCCGFGEYKCSVPMAINGKVQSIDFCIAHIVSALNAGGILTVASCCGHNKIDGSIVLDNGIELIIKKRLSNEY